MMEFNEGCTVPCADLIKEEYQLCCNGIMANVTTQKIRPLMEAFFKMHPGRKYFILELPLQAKSERSGQITRLKEVYYLDGLDKETLDRIWDLIGAWLLKDGMIQFGVGCLDYQEEIMFQIFNRVTVLSSEPEKYRNLFDSLSIPETRMFFPASRTFSHGGTGQTRHYIQDGKRIYDFVDQLKKMGMYFSEVRLMDLNG